MKTIIEMKYSQAENEWDECITNGILQSSEEDASIKNFYFKKSCICVRCSTRYCEKDIFACCWWNKSSDSLQSARDIKIIHSRALQIDLEGHTFAVCMNHAKLPKKNYFAFNSIDDDENYMFDRMHVWVRDVDDAETKKLTSRNSNLCLYYYYSMLDMCILNKLMQLTKISVWIKVRTKETFTPRLSIVFYVQTSALRKKKYNTLCCCAQQTISFEEWCRKN